VIDEDELERVDTAYGEKYVDPGSGTSATIFVENDQVYRDQTPRLPPTHRPRQLLPTCRNTTRRGYGHTHQLRARSVILARPWCSSCGSTDDLTADLVIPIIDGGVHGALRVLCRTCNSRLRD
jgi:5-methylcytosine-specific restriction endonuclease McrA